LQLASSEAAAGRPRLSQARVKRRATAIVGTGRIRMSISNTVGYTKTLAHGWVLRANRPTHSNRQTDDLWRLHL